MTFVKWLTLAAASLPVLVHAHPGHHAAPGHEHGPELGFAVGLVVAILGALIVTAAKAFSRRRRSVTARRAR